MIIVEYYYIDGIAEFALPMDSKIEAELYIQYKFRCIDEDKSNYKYSCSLDEYVDCNGNAVYFWQDKEFTLDDFRFLTVDEYVNEIMLNEKK